jgi:hypothetical protein
MQDTARTNQFLMLDWLRGQLEEIHDDLNRVLLGKLTKKSVEGLKTTPLNYNGNRTVQCRISITNIEEGRPEYVVNELSRLSTAVVCLGNTITSMKSTPVVNENDNE